MGSKKSKNGIFFEATETQKRKIKKNAALCGMRQGEYILEGRSAMNPKRFSRTPFIISTRIYATCSIRN